MRIGFFFSIHIGSRHHANSRHVGGQQMRRAESARGVRHGRQSRGGVMGRVVHGNIGQEQCERNGAVSGKHQQQQKRKKYAHHIKTIYALPPTRCFILNIRFAGAAEYGENPRRILAAGRQEKQKDQAKEEGRCRGGRCGQRIGGGGGGFRFVDDRWRGGWGE